MFPFGQSGFSISIAIITIMLILSGMTLGLGYAINNKKLRDFGKEEIIQSLINGILIGSLLVLFMNNGLVSSIISSVTFSSVTSATCQSFMANNQAICFAYNYLVGTTPYTFNGSTETSILTDITVLLSALSVIEMALGVIAAVKISLLVITISFGSLINPVISELQYIMQIASSIALGVAVQGAVLMFASATAITTIMPSGLILRCFYPTRKLGGFLIAVSIGLYVIFPMTYLLDAIIANSYQTGLGSISAASDLTITASQTEGEVLHIANIKNQSSSPVSSISLLNSVSTFTSEVTTFVNGIFDGIAYLIVYTFVLPGFSLILTGISIRELASLFGSEAFFGKFNLI